MDLTGNRLRKVTDKGRDGTINETIAYRYDSNDRLLVESLDSDHSGQVDQTTVYGWGVDDAGTEQTSKTAYLGTDTSTNGTKLAETEFAYNLQGRLEGATIRTYTAGSLTATSTTGYRYNDSGIRVSQTIDGVLTEYVIDASGGHTGYAQVLEEWVGATLNKTYTLGHDVIAQASTAAQTSGNGVAIAANAPLTFLYDGHGSTRALLDALGAAAERYAYDAYGNLLVGQHLTSSNTLASLLYSGEQFDAKLQMQYLRARYYNAQSGRFSRLDPFAGVATVPLSLNKYAYAHANPVANTDPTGEFTLIELGAVILISAVVVAAWSATGYWPLGYQRTLTNAQTPVLNHMDIISVNDGGGQALSNTGQQFIVNNGRATYRDIPGKFALDSVYYADRHDIWVYSGHGTALPFTSAQLSQQIIRSQYINSGAPRMMVFTVCSGNQYMVDAHNAGVKFAVGSTSQNYVGPMQDFNDLLIERIFDSSTSDTLATVFHEWLNSNKQNPQYQAIANPGVIRINNEDVFNSKGGVRNFPGANEDIDKWKP